MNVNLDTFNRQLAGLTGRFADLGAKLAEAAREMQDGGAPPAEALVEALAAARPEFVELLAEIVAAAESLGVAVPDHVESAKSLEPVLAAMVAATAAMVAATDARRRRAAFDEIRGRILGIYDRIAGIHHEGDETFAPLVALQTSAKEAKAAALALTEATTDQARALMEAAGPFADLLTMLESTEALDDETAQWWLAAWARWSGWKNTLAYPEAVREELSKYPYLLSVPIQQSPEFEEGLLAYGYSIIMEHVEKQKPGSVGNALNNLKTAQTKPVGTQLRSEEHTSELQSQ